MRVFLASLREQQQAWEGGGYVSRIAALLSSSKQHCQAETPDAADVVLFLENNITKSVHDFGAFSNTPLLRKWCHKSFVLNYADTPAPFLPGLYVCLPFPAYDPSWTRAIPYPWPSPNPHLATFQSHVRDPINEVCFRGSMSHPIRRTLIDLLEGNRYLGPCLEVNRWFNHSDEENLLYLREIANSKFILCPRGIGTSSHRLYEALRLARVPVIISDDWVPPEGVDWGSCSIRIAEDRLTDLSSVISAFSGRWSAMSVAASRVWNSCFSDTVLADYLFNQLESLVWTRKPAVDWAFMEKRWRSMSFRRQNKWDTLSRLRRIPSRIDRLFSQK